MKNDENRSSLNTLLMCIEISEESLSPLGFFRQLTLEDVGSSIHLLKCFCLPHLAPRAPPRTRREVPTEQIG